MVQMNFGPYLETQIKQKKEDLSKDIHQIRLEDTIARNKPGVFSTRTIVLAQIGKKLVDFGTILEQRYSQNPVESRTLKQQNSDGCP